MLTEGGSGYSIYIARDRCVMYVLTDDIFMLHDSAAITIFHYVV